MHDDKIEMMGEPQGYKQNADSKRTLDADCLNDTIQEACRLALIFKRFCAENNLPATAEIAGCAWDVHATNEKSYIDGKEYEKNRIKFILGLNEASCNSTEVDLEQLLEWAAENRPKQYAKFITESIWREHM